MALVDNGLSEDIECFNKDGIGSLYILRIEEEIKTQIIPFNIEKAKQGAKIITRFGLNARVIAYDRNDKSYPIIALVKTRDGNEIVREYTEDGSNNKGGNNYVFDLFIEEEVE